MRPFTKTAQPRGLAIGVSQMRGWNGLMAQSTLISRKTKTLFLVSIADITTRAVLFSGAARLLAGCRPPTQPALEHIQVTWSPDGL